MLRFLISLITGTLLGVGAGIFLGWGPLAPEYTGSPASELAVEFRDEYTVMVADGYRADDDLTSAIERLRVLAPESIPDHVQDTTERYISNSRDIRDIQSLVVLSEALGRLTPIMGPYREVDVPDPRGDA
ncbi:MAG: hypothetical protein AAF125_05310 [Chloroflexota bacterium]